MIESYLSNQRLINTFKNAEPNFEVNPFKSLYQVLYDTGFISDNVSKIQGAGITVEPYDNSVMWLILDDAKVNITMGPNIRQLLVPAGSIVSTFGRVDQLTIDFSGPSVVYQIIKAKFKLTRKALGRGGYGIVYEACMGKNCDFVYKNYLRLKHESAFQEEVRISKIFSRHNIGPRVYDVDLVERVIISEKLIQDLGQYSANFIAENLEDTDLRLLSFRIGSANSIYRFDLSKVRAYAPMIQKCNALYQNILDAGCSHGDFKLDNIMLNRFEEVRAIDLDPSFVSCEEELIRGRDMQDGEDDTLIEEKNIFLGSDFFRFNVRATDLRSMPFDKYKYLITTIPQGSVYCVTSRNLKDLIALGQYLPSLNFIAEFPLNFGHIGESEPRKGPIMWAETQNGRAIGFSNSLLHRERRNINLPSDISELVDIMEELHYQYLNQTISSMTNVDLKALETSCGIFNQYQLPKVVSPDARCYQYYFDNRRVNGVTYGSEIPYVEELFIEAIEKRYLDVIKYFVESGSIYNYDKAIEKATQLGHADIVEYLTSYRDIDR